MAGELSPDRLFYWDGQQWVSAFSPDGSWRWDGGAWRSASSTSRRKPSRLVGLVAGAVVLSLVVGGFGIYTLSSVFLSRLQSVFQGSNFTIACTSPQARPGAPVAEGDNLCGGRLGTSYFGVDCTTLGGQPPGVNVLDRVGISEWQRADVSVDATGCGMVAAPDHTRSFDTANVVGASAVAIADFVPVGSPVTVGIQVACTKQASCVDFLIFDDSTFSLDEGKPNDGFQNLTRGVVGLFSPIVKVGKTNRLILRVRGRQVTVILNGLEIVHATTRQVQSPGYVSFYLDDRPSTKIATVQLQRLMVFSAQ